MLSVDLNRINPRYNVNDNMQLRNKALDPNTAKGNKMICLPLRRGT